MRFPPGDPEDPKNWSAGVKWAATLALSAQGFNRIMISTIMAPAISVIATDLNMSNVESTMALSVYVLASAFGPMVIGPLSEVYGRKKIIHITNIWFLAWNLICGFANSKGLLIAARLLAGFGASAVYTIAYGVLADIWPAEQRGRSLSIYLLVPLTGAAVGPIVGGFIVEYSTWRWMFWATTIFQVVAEIATLPVIRETYAPLLLRRRARLSREGNSGSRQVTDGENEIEEPSALNALSTALGRPIQLLAFHPIIQVQALLGGLEYGLLYFALASFSQLFVNNYQESISISGLHYIALAVGEIAGALLCGPLMDRVYAILTSRAGDRSSPELRVPLLLPSLLITPAGFFLYGWAAEYQLIWIVVDVGGALLTMGMQVFSTTLHAYVMDAYPEHVSSASAATQLLSSLLAFAFPLFADRLYAALGYGWGNSLLAFLSVGITLPATCILWRYGARLRAMRDRKR
ncbi:MFS general substrate transporter [Dissoconium aciculare CBS 342.82]|uniref:MFS general substrate transporter n=1 Tax=Dissoconium aciculare CBS 342.82 TaxID=1314786 RepID=A0A6J3M5G0_9PEZI|nr:MFS general substrate transporter [Dissoconium aciculare CBS 342.82]KAF1823285.1 MFS general substrate transporter [Dissoconium aciculare CBS 342.82]